MWGGILWVQDPLSLVNFAPVSLRVLPTPMRRTFGEAVTEGCMTSNEVPILGPELMAADTSQGQPSYR